MTLPGTHNLELYRGDTYAWIFRLWADDAQTVPKDLTGAVAAAEIRDAPGGLTVVALDCAITLPNIIEVALDVEMWAAMPAAGAWDLQTTYAATGEVRTVLAGTVTVTPDVTDSVPVARTVPRQHLGRRRQLHTRRVVLA